MRIIYTILCAMLLYGCVTKELRQDDTLLIYLKYKLYIPNGSDVISSNGNEDNLLIFRYGKEKGEKYLSLFDISNDIAKKFNCSPSTFFYYALNADKQSVCNNDILKEYHETYFSQTNKGVWDGEKITVYFGTSKNKTFLFLCDNTNKKVIVIETDFLTQQELKNIVRDLLK